MVYSPLLPYTHCRRSGSSSALPTPGYFLPIPAGRAYRAIFIGLNIVLGKSRPQWPSMVWYGMVWYDVT